MHCKDIFGNYFKLLSYTKLEEHPKVRMRNLHLHLREYGIENVKIFRRWEKLELKMAAFQNHRIFSLRRLKEDLIPVSIKHWQ